MGAAAGWLGMDAAAQVFLSGCSQVASLLAHHGAGGVGDNTPFGIDGIHGCQLHCRLPRLCCSRFDGRL